MGIFKKLSWYFKQEKITYFRGLLGLLLTVVIGIIPARLIGNLIDLIHNKQLTSSRLVFLLALLLGATIFQYVARYIWRTAIWGGAAKLERVLRTRLFSHFMNMDRPFYNRHRTGDLMAHATNDLSAIQRVAGGGILQFADSIITGGTTLIAMMMFVDWRLTLIAIIPFPLLAVMARYLGMKIHIAFGDSQAAFSKLNNKAQESISGIKVIKSLGQESEDVTDFNQQIDKTIEINRRVNRLDAMFDPVTTLIISISYVITIVYGGILVTNGTITIGNLVSFIAYLSRMIWPIFAVGMLFNTLERGNASYDRVMSLLGEKTAILDAKDGISTPPSGELKFDIDKFSYPDNREEPVLKNVHLDIKAGKTLGIVGKVGASKSTIMELILRQFDQYEGSISYGGHNIKDYQLDAYLPVIGYVPQNSFMFSESIRNNIRFALPEATDEQVEAAIVKSGLKNQVDKFPNGLDTNVGEEGISMSGGQRQRLAIARALIIDPELLILDDALSAVDAETESEILQHLHEERSGKTTIIAAHRLSSVMDADEIVVMENGQIIERGNHAQLMKKRGWYHEMFERQELQTKVEGGSTNG
ncbi:hypothetical protein C5L31_001555 [Secundilactobacillus malefermentans]|uniref:Uncharacterized protein n=1 Tax=Secundilactobacillus malefermentans TaxID=176292 RepID=A0A4R5NT82_9LACO|nr:ABC transporter transmembrane domain-containing protein [Secundilactobacillus malefermentans]KRM57045.1 xenobiotic-transporting ATPase [Secundilactobacillus malefermentans DSM 5705 = KCTC 3548]TDG80528.1 hypothetical protein C5L31_001555 [Secundilactobacillus malefermentans]